MERERERGDVRMLQDEWATEKEGKEWDHNRVDASKFFETTQSDGGAPTDRAADGQR